MQIQAAHIDQIRRANDGRMHLISADVGGVAADLARIDPGLKVRFAEHGRPPFWAVYWESEDGRETHLVLTQTAHQNGSGVWEGLDQRIVRRIQEIDPHGRSGYNYAGELAAHNERVKEQHRQEFRDKVGGTAEIAAWALRKDTGSRYKSRTFVPRDVPA